MCVCVCVCVCVCEYVCVCVCVCVCTLQYKPCSHVLKHGLGTRLNTIVLAKKLMRNEIEN